MAPAPRQVGTSGRLGSLIALCAFLVVLGVLFTHRKTLLRSSPARELSDGGSVENGNSLTLPVPPENMPRPNCDIPSPNGGEASTCGEAQKTLYATMKSETVDKFTGPAGYERTLGNLFNRFDGKIYFPRGRPITLVQIGGSNIIDRYGALGRGPRLDDHIVLIEANKETAHRLAGRIRMDQRLMLKHGAAWDQDVAAWFAYDKVPNYANNNGKLTMDMPANVTFAQNEGEVVQALKLDTLLSSITGPIDFIISDADLSEPNIFKGALETLKRTRMAAFSCNSMWQNKGPGYDLQSIIKTVFEPAGMVVSLLGESQNIILSHGMAPSDFDFLKNLPSWGFCVAVHVAPPIVRNLAEIARVVIGLDEPTNVCTKALSFTGPVSWCKDGLLETLGGIDTPIIKSDYEMPYY
jgi:hypothetical protein